jgi:hypothetical protein
VGGVDLDVTLPNIAAISLSKKAIGLIGRLQSDVALTAAITMRKNQHSVRIRYAIALGKHSNVRLRGTEGESAKANDASGDGAWKILLCKIDNSWKCDGRRRRLRRRFSSDGSGVFCHPIQRNEICHVKLKLSFVVSCDEKSVE